MANDIYVIDQIVTGTATIILTDDGTGFDWLVIQGTYTDVSDIRLSWSSDGVQSLSASGLYWTPGAGHRLIVNGLIENVRGGDGSDFIQGNEVNNRLEGDQTGAGAGDTIWGGDGRDRIFGMGGGDVLSGDLGNDDIYGGDGDDNISGASGRDTVEGGAGADTMSGGSETGDTVSYRGSDAGVTVTLTFGSTTIGAGGHAAGDNIVGFRNIFGSDLRDVLADSVAAEVAFGGNANVFYGFGGRDEMSLGGGNDSAYGGDDADRIWGEDGDDRGFGGNGNDTLNLGNGNDAGRGGADADILRGGAGSDSLYGEDGDDILFPNGGGDDFVYGGLGNDQILAEGGGSAVCFGGDGDDKLTGVGGTLDFTGGTGLDLYGFLFTLGASADYGTTTLHDFRRGLGETIDLRAISLPVAFIGTSAFSGSGTGAEVRFQSTATGTEVFVDVDGDGDANLTILLDGVGRALASDFLLT